MLQILLSLFLKVRISYLVYSARCWLSFAFRCLLCCFSCFCCFTSARAKFSRLHWTRLSQNTKKPSIFLAAMRDSSLFANINFQFLTSPWYLTFLLSSVTKLILLWSRNNMNELRLSTSPSHFSLTTEMKGMPISFRESIIHILKLSVSCHAFSGVAPPLSNLKW